MAVQGIASNHAVVAAQRRAPAERTEVGPDRDGDADDGAAGAKIAPANASTSVTTIDNILCVVIPHLRRMIRQLIFSSHKVCKK